MDEQYMIAFCMLLTLGFAVAFSILVQQSREKQKSSWRRLAAAHNLDFISNNSYFSDGAYVIGNYRGHSLKLETFEKKQGKSSATYTRIGIHTVGWYGSHQPTNQSAQFLTFQEALDRFVAPKFRHAIGGEIKTTAGGKPVYYERRDVVQDTQFLEYIFELLLSLAEAYPVVVAQGAEAIPLLHSALESNTLKQISLQLLRDTAQETSRRFAYRSQSVLCPRCLTRFDDHKMNLSWLENLTYYGCRTCGQSREFLEGSVIAVLDNQMTMGPTRQEGFVRINWSARRELFDFDAIEIVHATDEEVERFAVQAGNDTDPTRESRYRNMQCVILPSCQLSENTLRILQRTFKVVIANEAAHWTEKESGINSELLNNAQ
jgi:hypothetical protein